MGKIIEFFRLSGQVKVMMLEATVYSAIYRYQILHKPFKDMAPEIGTFRYETEQINIIDQTLDDTSWAVNAACKRVQWDSKCLDRALTAKKILNKRGYPCTLYMGVIMNEKNEMTAHAWLRCGNRWISGGDGSGYAITGIYGDVTEKKTKEYSVMIEADNSKGSSLSNSQYAEGNSCLVSVKMNPEMLSLAMMISQNLKEADIRSLFFLRPERKKRLHFLLHKNDLKHAEEVLLHKGYKKISSDDERVTLERESEEICLYTSVPSRFSDRFNALWNRRSTMENDRGKICHMGQLDEICYLISLTENGRENSTERMGEINDILRKQKVGIDELFNHARGRKVQHLLLNALVQLYRQDGRCLEPYIGSFIGIKLTGEKVILTYDPLLENDVEAIG